MMGGDFISTRDE